MNKIGAVAQVVIKELYRRKDFYVLFILTALITLLLGTLNFFNNDQTVRYLKDVCLLLIWTATLLIAIFTSARQIPAERENRTLFPLLAKPISRAQVLLGKFLGCVLASGLALVIFYLFFGILSGSREHLWPVLNYVQALWLHGCMLAVVIAMTLFGSVVFTAPSSNVTITALVVAGILMLGRHLHQVALQLPEPGQTLLSLLYFAMPHLEFFDVRDLIIHDWSLIPWSICGLATLYALAYSALFLLGAWLVFRKQTFN